MTDNLLLLAMLAGILIPAGLFFRERRGRMEYIVFGAGVLIILATFAILMVQQRSEPPQTALGTEEEAGAAALLLPGTATQAPVSPTSPPEQPAASAAASTPVAAETGAATPDVPTPRLTEDQAPPASPGVSTAPPEGSTASPEATVTTVRVGTANVRREPAANSPIVGTVALDDELVVLDTRGGWYQVRLGERHAPRSSLEGGQGWIWGELINAP